MLMGKLSADHDQNKIYKYTSIVIDEQIRTNEVKKRANNNRPI